MEKDTEAFLGLWHAAGVRWATVEKSLSLSFWLAAVCHSCPFCVQVLAGPTSEQASNISVLLTGWVMSLLHKLLSGEHTLWGRRKYDWRKGHFTGRAVQAFLKGNWEMCETAMWTQYFWVCLLDTCSSRTRRHPSQVYIFFFLPSLTIW